MTKSETIANDVAALLRACNPLLWVVTREEERVERYLFGAAAAAGYVPYTWDVGQGVADIAGKVQDGRNGQQEIGGPDPSATLAAISERTTKEGRFVWIMRDLHVWLKQPAVQRQVANLARKRGETPKQSAQALIILTSDPNVPPELAGHATVIEWPLPDRAEIAEILDMAIEVMPEDQRETAAPNGQREAAIDAAVGLSGEEANACYARSLVQLRKIDPALVASEKKRVIARERVLEWIEPIKGGLEAVGGLDNLKSWVGSRAIAYSPRAREYGLPAPKGVLLVGISGCGKTLTAKAIATAWVCPLLRVDLGALKSKFVGESEQNLRKVFQVIASVGRCVVWFDELEKMMQGATSGSADGGVSSDALGAILTWMQDRQGEAFVVATANDVSALPPELLRKGRFDEVFFVDLPNATERVAVLKAALKQYGRDPSDLGALESVAKNCEGFTGSEIAAIVPDAMFSAFGDNERELTCADLTAAAKTVVPLSKTASEKIDASRKWAVGRARPATAETTTRDVQPRVRRVLDI